MSFNVTSFITVFNKNATALLVYLNGNLFFSQHFKALSFVPSLAWSSHSKVMGVAFVFCVLQRFGLIPAQRVRSFYSKGFLKAQ